MEAFLRGGERSIDDHVIGKSHSHICHGAEQQALTGGILTVTGSIGFGVAGKRESGSGDADMTNLWW